VKLHNPDLLPRWAWESLLEIDPRPCSVCGATLDRHEPIDDGEGPIFYCLPPHEMTLPELGQRAELIRQIEVAAIMARMEAADVRCEPPARAEPRPYRTPQATIDAFWYVVGLGDPERFKAWLAARPDDAPFLLKLLEGK
jgi:hypothetical protein